jgi:hypothetical protein
MFGTAAAETTVYRIDGNGAYVSASSFTSQGSEVFNLFLGETKNHSKGAPTEDHLGYMYYTS